MQAITANVKTEKRSGLTKTSILSLYLNPPTEELTLDEFELLAVDRLQLLRSIEGLKTRGFEESQLNSKIRELEKRHLLGRKDIYGRLSEEKRDQVSHFILRLAYCSSEDLRRWFIAQECALFKYRLDEMSDEERSQFMVDNGLQYDRVEAGEKKRLEDKLTDLAGVSTGNFLNTQFYKVPFYQAPGLLGGRSIYLEGGLVYVPLQRLVSILVMRFRSLLSRALVEANSMFDVVRGDSRIAPFLQNINKQFLGNDFSQRMGGQNADKLTPDKVDQAAELNMPMCMKNLHSALKREHKIKHWGRLQYGLFLKGAGLDLEGAVSFFESHFTKVMAHDQFQKGYSYSFRHMYGKEGGRKNYTPYSCLKIIMGVPPEAGAYHGCPFKHATDNQLVSLLTAQKIGMNEVKEIVGQAKGGNYQLACQRHFDVLHPNHYAMDLKTSDTVANHPNQWFLASVAYFKAKSGVSLTAGPPINEGNMGAAVEGGGGGRGLGVESTSAEGINLMEI